MKNNAFEFTVADQDFYAPLASASGPGESYSPRQPAPGWKAGRSGRWTMWRPCGSLDGAEDGWKVHVSARHDRLQEVLDTAAGICFSQGVPFKHLSTPRFFWWSQYKYAARSQGGKFITAYPPDTPAAGRLMEALRVALAAEDGPYILSDRRFRDSRIVHYRYGAFISRERIQADGTRVLLVRDGHGHLVHDRRGASFHLPAGITDPFIGPEPYVSPEPGSPVTLGDFVIESAIRHSNTGGTYSGYHATTGRRVFIKEARPHMGRREDNAAAPEQLREEWTALTALHGVAPGLVPEPIAYLREWEHEFVVTEFVAGTTLGRWVAANKPLGYAGATPDDFARYYERCEKILAAVRRDLERMHQAGYLFVDVSPNNLLVGPGDTVRLVDFGAAHGLGSRFTPQGTPGYTPPPRLVGDDLTIFDDYGLAGLAQLLVCPMHQVTEREPDALRHVHYDVSEEAPVPPGLWARATRFHQLSSEPRLPGPEEVAADPARHLSDLRHAVADALVATADADHADRVFPTIVEGYRTNTLCVAYGTAGVVHALRQAGRPLPDGVADRLRRDAVAHADELPPGLYVGLSGIAWVLADLGLLDEAASLLATAAKNPLTSESATLYGGSAGVALTHLALYGHTRDEFHIDRALALAAALPPDDNLAPHLGPDDATGLMHGRCGIALMLQQLAAVSGDSAALARARRLLHVELDRASDPDGPGLLFPVSTTDRRQMPYLSCGSAGMTMAVSRYLRTAHDDRLAAALPRLLAPVRRTYSVMPGLFMGLASFAFILADHVALTGDESSRLAALRVARALFKYAIPHPTGVRYLGHPLLRYSAELWSGSSGIMLALTQVLRPRPDTLFTVDTLAGALRPTQQGSAAGLGAAAMASGR